jgi:hypothetical protein
VAGKKEFIAGVGRLLKPSKTPAKTTAEMAHELAQHRATLPVNLGGLGLPPGNTAMDRAKAQKYVDYYHGTQRLDRLLEKPELNPKRATSGPMPYGTTTKELASNYAMQKPDTSRINLDEGDVSNYFQVSPKDLGASGRSPISVERSWHYLSPEQKQLIANLAPRVGYENLNEFTGPFVVHPEGVNATLSPSQWDWIMNNSAKQNPLAALREMWHDSGQLYGKEEDLAKIYGLAGYKVPISQTNAPWTEAQGVLLGMVRTNNPLNTSDSEYLKSILPSLKDAFARDRSRLKIGPDQWGKESRYTPKDWVSQLEKDLSSGEESYVWTSIPDKVTEELKKLGHDSILDVSGKGGGAKEPVVIPFAPSQVRSRFAAFDPFEIESSDLLKKNGGAVRMQSGGKMGAVSSLVRAFGKPATKTKPFYSPVDEAIANITQGKGTADQFLAMISKSKGVKPQEIKDRNLGVLLSGKGKMTKADLEKIAAENPPPQVVEREIGERAFNARVEEVAEDLRADKVWEYRSQGESQKNAEWLADSDSDEFYRKAHAKVMDEGLHDPRYEKYTIPGGENYREIVFKLPDTTNEAKKDLSAFQKKMRDKYDDMNWRRHADDEEKLEGDRLTSEANKAVFRSTHYDDPNVFAHARVTDRIGPNGEKILHIEEIQSDWHQEARELRKKEVKRLMAEGLDKASANKMVPEDYGYGKELNPEDVVLDNVEGQVHYFTAPSGASFRINASSIEEATEKAIEAVRGNSYYKTRDGVPDAPFKKDWHELVLKRLIDDAARNGYDRIYITPGAEQSERYKLSKQISKIEYEPTAEPGKYEFIAYDKKGKEIIHEDKISPSRIEELVGKDLAQKIEADQGTKINEGGYRDWREIAGLDLDVESKGMLGFYDQMVPSFLNKYGEKYGAKVGSMSVTKPPENSMDVMGYTLGREYTQGSATWSDFLSANPRAAEQFSVPVHSFDITPDMRSAVTEKGVPLYVGAPIGAVPIGAELVDQEPTEYRRGGPVNMDAMRFAVQNKQLRKKHG